MIASNRAVYSSSSNTVGALVVVFVVVVVLGGRRRRGGGGGIRDAEDMVGAQISVAPTSDDVLCVLCVCVS